ncbi:MAG: PAS domain S-box protein [Aphanothece sp. CMT-3BRIN-NPC111]|jgi:hypothetical protein|nr:PAS domain S-box protein [Aphanothece sp. CMT-3BRIN-NPC111]
MTDLDKTKDELIDELVALRQRVAELERLEIEHQHSESALRQRLTQLQARTEAPPTDFTKIQVSGYDIEWNSVQGTCTALNLPVVLMWIDTTLASLMAGIQAMVGTQRFALALQSEGRKSVAADWQVISQYPNFQDGFAALAKLATVAGWGDWQLISIDWTKQECNFRIRNSWEGRYQKALGVCWGSGMLAGKLAGYCSKLFETNYWSEQTAFIARGDEFDEFMVRPSKRSLEEEIERLLETDNATRADMAVALQKLQREVTERQQVEAALRESEERLRLALEAAKMGFWDWDIVNNNVAWSKNHELLFGLADGTFKGTYEAFLELVHPDDQKSVVAVLARALEEKTDYSDEFRILWPDSSIHWIEAKGQFFYDEAGQAIRALGVCMDISDRKHNEQAVRESKDRYRQLVELSPDTVFIQSEGKFVFVNSAGVKLFGAANPEQLIGKEILNYIHTNYHELVKERIQQIVEATQEASLIEEKFIRLDGTVVDVEVAASPFTYNGKPAVQVVARDITERKQAEEVLKERAVVLQNQQAWLEDALHLMPSPLLFIEPGTAKVTFANKAADELAGGKFPQDKPAEEYHTIYYCTDAAGKRIPDEQMPGVRLARGESLQGFEMDWHTPGGIRSLLIFAETLPAMHGHPATCVLVFQDITQIKQLQEALRQQTEELVQANRMKDEFLSILSHELRTPLNSILGWSRLLCTRKMNEAATTKALQTIERNAAVQAQLIEDILDVSRIITGKLRLKVCPVEIKRVIGASIDTVRPAADAKEIQIQTLLDSSPDVVSGDPDRLQQVIWNLLSNAIKFTPKGGKIQVQVECINSQVQVSVTDTGQGINADFLPYVFERFRQADGTSTRSHGGLGLGLAIVRHLVELHGGTVEVESPGVGQGATFTVKLPIVAVRRDESNLVQLSAIATSTEPSNDSPQLQNLRILVVDDEADARELLTTILEECGAQVATAASASEALDSLEQFKPDVLLSDIGMPNEDGYTLMRKIRALKPERGGQIPAAALTAYAGTQDRTQALLAGFQTHVPKPVELVELIAVVASLAGRAGKV